MSRIPPFDAPKRSVAIVREGLEEQIYLSRLNKLDVWSDAYDFHFINVGGEGNVYAKHTDLCQNDRYDIVLAFCDTDRQSGGIYNDLKKKIDSFHGKSKASGKVVIFANPCSMQIALSHFGDVSLRTQSKKQNAAVIKRLTGVDNHNAHRDQITAVCNKILKRSYPEMRKRVARIDLPGTIAPSANFIVFLKFFESDNIRWIKAVKQALG